MLAISSISLPSKGSILFINQSTKLKKKSIELIFFLVKVAYDWNLSYKITWIHLIMENKWDDAGWNLRPYIWCPCKATNRVGFRSFKDVCGLFKLEVHNSTLYCINHRITQSGD